MNDLAMLREPCAPDPAAPRSGDKARLEAREREALRQRAEDADGWQRRAEHAEAELAALAARSGAAPQPDEVSPLEVRVGALIDKLVADQGVPDDWWREDWQSLRSELAALAAARLALHTANAQLAADVEAYHEGVYGLFQRYCPEALREVPVQGRHSEWAPVLTRHLDARDEDSRAVLQAVLDAIKGTIDPHTQIADHPNVKFAREEPQS